MTIHNISASSTKHEYLDNTIFTLVLMYHDEYNDGYSRKYPDLDTQHPWLAPYVYSPVFYRHEHPHINGYAPYVMDPPVLNLSHSKFVTVLEWPDVEFIADGGSIIYNAIMIYEGATRTVSNSENLRYFSNSYFSYFFKEDQIIEDGEINRITRIIKPTI